MSVIKNVFARLWAIWGALFFIATLLICIIPFIICFAWPEPRRSIMAYPIFRRWMDVFLFMIGVRLKIRGKHFFEKGKNYVVVCNHRSMMDIPVSSPRIPGPNKTIAKIEMSRIPVFGLVYQLGSILVDRKDKDSRRNSFAKMKAVLEMGLHMCIYPEGTRNKSKEPLKEFHDGAFRLAVDTQKEIIPAALFGTNHILPNNKTFYLMPGIIEFHFLSSIPPGYDVQGLRDITFQTMRSHILAHQKSAK